MMVRNPGVCIGGGAGNGPVSYNEEVKVGDILDTRFCYNYWIRNLDDVF